MKKIIEQTEWWAKLAWSKDMRLYYM
jgi:hypothetical protein